MAYESADEWRSHAMARPDGVDEREQARRRKIAVDYYATESTVPDADTLADQELYIRGKMELEEYQRYLVFKHGQGLK